MTGQIEHDGIIDSVDAKMIRVRIISESACSACHAKGACSASDMQEKMVDIPVNEQSYQVGQRVIIAASQSQGFKAVFLAYVIPSVIILATLGFIYYLTGSDIIAGISSISIAIAYFTILYILKHKMEASFSFHIKQS
jgi:sigma-E factor negative regulatory protein RseC